MFNFDKKQFDFNSVLESKQHIYALSLDDFDDEELDNPSSSQPMSSRTLDDIIDTEIDFRIFLKVNVFKPIDVDIDVNSGNEKTFSNRCAWKTYTINGEKHYFAYINIIQERNSKKYEHDLYVDLNDETKELHIGNCTTYKTSKFLNISYPLIKICEHYKDGPVYIGCLNYDKPFSTRVSANDIIKGIEFPLEYIGVTENITFWRTVWNKKGYYLPDVRPGMSLMEIDDELKLTSEFVEHFNGLDSKLRHGTKISLFYNMFNSFEDFAKITKIFCDANALVFTEFGIELTKSSYDENIVEFENRLNSKLDLEAKKKQNIATAENFAKNYLIDILPQNVIEHFESINTKSPNLLSIRTMAKERKSKDPYRKLDLPVVKLILKDNGIDVDKITNNYEQQWLSTFYNFTNTFYKHCKRLNVDSSMNSYGVYPTYDFVVDNLFIYDRFNIKYTDENGEKRDFDELTKDELSMIKDLVLGIKPNLVWEDNDLIIDKQRLDDPNDELLVYLCRKLLYAFGNYPGSIIESDVDNHVYNEFLIIQRFIYLLYKQYVEDYNKNLNDDEKPLEEPNISLLYNMRFNYVEYGYYSTLGGYYPFNFGDIGMKLNTYNQLYKFLTYISYAIENGYDIHCPNLGWACDSKERLLRENGMTDYSSNHEAITNSINNEFSLNNKPNLKVLNMTSIIKMLSTIFTNIDNKI